MPGHVLAALHEELGRVRGEAHLDPLPVRLLDDLEHRVLVEGGLGEDHLVRTTSLEDRGELGESAEPGETGARCLGDGADELVRDPARAAASERCSRARLSPSPTRTTLRRIPATRITSSETDA